MSELHNPLFDEEKEFLERKKLEYERALLGDVEHIKEQSATVGKLALVGAGLAGTVWLISKAFGGKKRRAEGKPRPDGKPKGKEKGQPKDKRKSAAASAMVFMDHFEDGDHEFGGGVARPNAQPVGALASAAPRPADGGTAPEPATPALRLKQPRNRPWPSPSPLRRPPNRLMPTTTLSRICPTMIAAACGLRSLSIKKPIRTPPPTKASRHRR